MEKSDSYEEKPNFTDLTVTKEFLDSKSKIVNNNAILLNLENKIEIKESNKKNINDTAQSLFLTPKIIRQDKINEELSKMRWKREKDNIVSNSKLLKLEDGTYALKIGNKIKKLNKKEQDLNLYNKKNELLTYMTNFKHELNDIVK